MIVEVDVDVGVEGDALIFLSSTVDEVIEDAEVAAIHEGVPEVVEVVDNFLIDDSLDDGSFGDGQFIGSFEIVEDVLFK